MTSDGTVNQDDVDTAPIVSAESSSMERMSADVGPDHRYALTIAPAKPMHSPLLLMSARPRSEDAFAEQISCGDAVVFGELPVEGFRLGRTIESRTISRRTPLRVVLANRGSTKITVVVSLIEKPDATRPGSYRKRG